MQTEQAVLTQGRVTDWDDFGGGGGAQLLSVCSDQIHNNQLLSCCKNNVYINGLIICLSSQPDFRTHNQLLIDHSPNLNDHFA